MGCYILTNYSLEGGAKEVKYPNDVFPGPNDTTTDIDWDLCHQYCMNGKYEQICKIGDIVGTVAVSDTTIKRLRIRVVGFKHHEVTEYDQYYDTYPDKIAAITFQFVDVLGTYDTVAYSSGSTSSKNRHYNVSKVATQCTNLYKAIVEATPSFANASIKMGAPLVKDRDFLSATNKILGYNFLSPSLQEIYGDDYSTTSFYSSLPKIGVEGTQLEYYKQLAASNNSSSYPIPSAGIAKGWNTSFTGPNTGYWLRTVYATETTSSDNYNDGLCLTTYSGYISRESKPYAVTHGICPIFCC